MYRIWIKGHKLPIGADTQESVDEIRCVYGQDRIVLVEKKPNYKFDSYLEYLELTSQ